jgi:hypothetical protein
MRKFLIAALAALAGGAALVVSAPAAEAREAKVYKNPQCGCCQEHADYLRENGFEVAVEPTHGLAMMNRMAGIPEGMAGCHLTFVGDYVVSGHVPVETIERLLEQKPAIKGITLPGMPMGSPGMGGEKQAPFTIYEIGAGEPTVYAVE